MTMPTISIDGISISVNRDGTDFMHYAQCAAQDFGVAQGGAGFIRCFVPNSVTGKIDAFEDAVRLFRCAMDEVPAGTFAGTVREIAVDVAMPQVVTADVAPQSSLPSLPSSQQPQLSGALEATRPTNAATVEVSPRVVVEVTPQVVVAEAEPKEMVGRIGLNPPSPTLQPQVVTADVAPQSSLLSLPSSQQPQLPGALEATCPTNAAAVEVMLSAVPQTAVIEAVPEVAVANDGVLRNLAGIEIRFLRDDSRVASQTVSMPGPVVVESQQQTIDLRGVSAPSASEVAASTARQVHATTPAQVLVEAASAVADTMTVSPGLLRGAGEIEVKLRSDVLDGTVVRIVTTEPGKMSVQFVPANAEMAVLLEKCAPQLVAYLSGRVHSLQVSVSVKRDDKLKG